MKKKIRNSYLRFISDVIRLRAFKTIFNANSGHIGASSSSTEIMTCLYFGDVLRFDIKDPKHPARDRVLVRGHLGPLRYSIFSLLKWIDEKELDNFLKLGSPLQGHETMDLVPGIDITPSGSLGMLMSYGVGAAYSLRKFSYSSRVFVFLGDGEEQEGNISEAARHASSLGLNNIICIIDRNKKQLSCPTSTTDSNANLEKIWEGYGWEIVNINNGHSIEEIMNVLDNIGNQNKPLLIIVDTIKGNGLDEAESHISGYHTFRTCGPERVRKSMKKLERKIYSYGYHTDQIVSFLTSQIAALEYPQELMTNPVGAIKFTNFDGSVEDDVTKYLKQLVYKAKEADKHLYVLTADWTTEDIVRSCGFNSPNVEFINVGIREQHMFSMAHGIATTDKNCLIIIICGDAFILRSADQLNAIAQAGSPILIIGTDSGITSTTNGATHQSSGQPAALIYMPGLEFVEPADSEDALNCINSFLAKQKNPFYIRLHAGVCKPIHAINKNVISYVAYEPTSQPDICIATSGVTVGNAIQAAIELDDEEIKVRVINIISQQHLGADFVKSIANNTPLLIIYNGNSQIVSSAISDVILKTMQNAPSKIANIGFEIGTTGSLEELMKYFKIDTNNIKINIKQFLNI